MRFILICIFLAAARLSSELAASRERERALERERDDAEAEVKRLREALAFADEQSAKVEALLEPHIKWDDDAEQRLGE